MNERSFVAHLIAIIWSREYRDAFAVVRYFVPFILSSIEERLETNSL